MALILKFKIDLKFAFIAILDMGAGMGKGPALALLLFGPALSLPSILVIQALLGWKKTLVYAMLVVVQSAAAGTIYGMFSS